MQTKLRILVVSIVASLLWITPKSVVSQRATSAEGKVKGLKAKYIGTASWYGAQHQGLKMANGQRFDRRKLTAASWDFPLGTVLRVVNVKNGESVVVTITDRGPNHRLNRILDLSEAAAQRIGYVEEGLASVFLYPLPTIETAAAALDSAVLEAPAHQPSGDLAAAMILMHK